MDRLEKAEKVCAKTGVSFEDAKTALEACDYDVLDAIVWLEQHGKARAGASAHASTGPEQDVSSAEMSQAQSAYERATQDAGFTRALNRVLEWIKRLLRKSVDTSFVVEHRGRQVISIPTLLLVLLVVFAFWITLPLLVIGLFCNFKYHFEGIGRLTVDINEMADKVADGAESLKKDVMGSAEQGYASTRDDADGTGRA